MISLSIFNHNAPLLMTCMVLTMACAFIGVYPQLNRNSNQGLTFFPTFLLALFTSIFSIQSGDFVYHTLILQKGGRGLAHLEDFYIDLWNFYPDVLFWRTVVFGGSLILLFQTIKLLNLNARFSCFIFVITQLFYFGQMRNMLGFMVLFFSVSVCFALYGKQKKIIGIILCLSGLWLCTFFHKSMWMYVLLLIPALIPFGKKSIKMSLFIFPILYGSIFILSSWFLGIFATDEMMQHGAYYTEGKREITFMQMLREIILQGCYLYLLYIVLKDYCKSDTCFPSAIKFLTRYSYILIYIGLLFYGQHTGGWLFVRFVGAGEISFMFVMMYFFYRYPRTKGVKMAFIGLILCTVYQMIYICTWASSNFINRFNLIEI